MTIEVFNPVGEVAPAATARAVMLDRVRRRSAGLVCNHHPAIEELWAQLESGIERDWQPSGMHRIAKANISMPQPAAELARLASAVDYVLVGVGA